MVTLRCECCGFVQTFDNAETAFQLGWDEPTHLPSWPVTCSLCPGTGPMGLIDHSKAHERWEREGRPEEFDKIDFPEDVVAGAERLQKAVELLGDRVYTFEEMIEAILNELG